jgi:hypothetical protein
LDLGNSVESPSSVCKFCSRAFRSEKTLAAHVCEKKRRNMMKDEKYVQMGFRAFQRFYEMTDQSTKQKTWEDFVKNKFYISFTKFGKFCYDMQVVMFAEYTDFVIKNGLKIEAWIRDETYEIYINDYQRRESIDVALERSIKFMELWAEKYKHSWEDFFRKCDRGLLTYWLKTGRISPWILLNCDSGIGCLNDLSDEQMSIISSQIDPSFWSRRLSSNETDCESVKSILKQAGL